MLWAPDRQVIVPGRWPGIIVPKRVRLPRLQRVPWLVAPAFVKQAGNDDAFSSSIDATFGSAVTSGNVVVACVGTEGGGNPTITSITGLTGATWTSIVDSATQARGHKAIWLGTGFTGGTVVTLTISAQARIGLIVAEFSGVSSTTDGTNSAGGLSTAPATGNITTTNASDLVVITFASVPNTVTGDPPTGYTAFTQRTAGINTFGDYRITSSTGTFSGAWTLNNSIEWEALIAAFQASGGAAGWGHLLGEGRNRLVYLRG